MLIQLHIFLGKLKLYNHTTKKYAQDYKMNVGISGFIAVVSPTPKLHASLAFLSLETTQHIACGNKLQMQALLSLIQAIIHLLKLGWLRMDPKSNTHPSPNDLGPSMLNGFSPLHT